MSLAGFNSYSVADGTVSSIYYDDHNSTWRPSLMPTYEDDGGGHWDDGGGQPAWQPKEDLAAAWSRADLTQWTNEKLPSSYPYEQEIRSPSQQPYLSAPAVRELVPFTVRPQRLSPKTLLSVSQGGPMDFWVVHPTRSSLGSSSQILPACHEVLPFYDPQTDEKSSPANVVYNNEPYQLEEDDKSGGRPQECSVGLLDDRRSFGDRLSGYSLTEQFMCGANWASYATSNLQDVSVFKPDERGEVLPTGVTDSEFQSRGASREEQLGAYAWNEAACRSSAEKPQFDAAYVGTPLQPFSPQMTLESLTKEYKSLLKNIPIKAKETTASASDQAAFKTCHPDYSRVCLVLMQSGYDIRLGEVGRAALKKEISKRLRSDASLREKCVSRVCRLKNANVLQLLQMAEIAGCLEMGLEISSRYWREYSRKQRTAATTGLRKSKTDASRQKAAYDDTMQQRMMSQLSEYARPFVKPAADKHFRQATYDQQQDSLFSTPPLYNADGRFVSDSSSSSGCSLAPRETLEAFAVPRHSAPTRGTRLSSGAAKPKAARRPKRQTAPRQPPKRKAALKAPALYDPLAVNFNGIMQPPGMFMHLLPEGFSYDPSSSTQSLHDEPESCFLSSLSAELTNGFKMEEAPVVKRQRVDDATRR